jgi:dTMP kinase
MHLVVDGIDGSGKDSHADLLVRALTALHPDKPPLRLSEPSKSDIGQVLRKSLHSGEYKRAHAALFTADRISQLTNVVLPALARGQDVVCVRSFLSTLVYQQEEVPFRQLLNWNWHLPAYPDKIIVLDADPAVTLQRDARATNPEIYEKLELQQRFRERYRTYATSPWLEKLTGQPGVGVVVSAAGTVAETHALICQALGIPPVVL